MLSVGQAQTLSTVSTPNDTDDYKTVNVGAGDYGVWCPGIARPLPCGRLVDQSRSNGIEMDIAADDPVIGLILDHLRPVTSLKEVPHTAVPQSVPSSVGREKLLHTQCEVGARGLDQQMQMVAHEDEGRQFPLTPQHRAPQVVEQSLTVRVVVNDPPGQPNGGVRRPAPNETIRNESSRDQRAVKANFSACHPPSPSMRCLVRN